MDATTIAGRIADDVRALNYTTLPREGFPGLDWPEDASDTIAALAWPTGTAATRAGPTPRSTPRARRCGARRTRRAGYGSGSRARATRPPLWPSTITTPADLTPLIGRSAEMTGTPRPVAAPSAARRLAVQARLLARLTRPDGLRDAGVADLADIVRQLSSSTCQHAAAVDGLAACLIGRGRNGPRSGPAGVLLAVGGELDRTARSLWQIDDVLDQAALDLRGLAPATDRTRRPS